MASRVWLPVHAERMLCTLVNSILGMRDHLDDHLLNACTLTVK